MFQKVSDQHPTRHAKHFVERDGIVFTATPCYGMHEPWWVVRTMATENLGEVAPVPMRPDDVWCPLEEARIGFLERQACKVEIARLRSIIDMITGPPLTPEQAEAELADLDGSALNADEQAARESIDIKAIIAYATDPTNMSPEEAVRRMIEAARACTCGAFGVGVDGGEQLREAEGWLERRFP